MKHPIKTIQPPECAHCKDIRDPLAHGSRRLYDHQKLISIFSLLVNNSQRWMKIICTFKDIQYSPHTASISEHNLSTVQLDAHITIVKA